MTLTLFSRSLHYKDSKSELCVHSISWINRWNLTKLAQIHYWDWGQKFRFFTFISFSRLHRHFETHILIEEKFVLNQWLEFYQTSTDTSLGHGKKWLDFGDLDLIFKVTRSLWNSNFAIKKLAIKKLVCTLSLYPLLQVSKRSLWSVILYNFCHDLIHVYSPGARAYSPRGQSFDVNRNFLSLRSSVASFKS